MKYRSIASAVISVSLLALAGASPARAADGDLVARGAYLARAGDCISCHTATGGQPFAGGDAINSPFGPIYPPNITPDKATGIGDWTDDDFYKAMHEGVDKHGQYLYPAFPYQWFTKVSRDDVLAIKAYLDTLAPVNAKPRQTRLMFPFDLRIGVGGWDAAYFHPGEFKPDPAKSAQINRGAYLVEGLGHCGDCHTPKGIAMEPLEAQRFSGGAIDKWYAPNITSDAKRGIGAWSDEDLVKYLKTGSAPGKGVAVGPMSQVVHDSLAYLTDDDVRAIVAFLKDTPPIADYKETRAGDLAGAHSPGRDVYVSHCAYCHQLNGKGLPGAIPALDGNGVVGAKGPEDVIRVILGGRFATGSYAPMPAVGADMTDSEIADVTNYVRNAWSNAAPGAAEAGLVGETRAETAGPLSGRPAKGAKDVCQLGPDAPPVAPLVDPTHSIEQTLAGMKGETMLATIDQLIAQTRQAAPNASSADMINGLTLAYCRTFAKGAAGLEPDQRRLLNRFSQLVYTQIASNGKD